MKRTIRILLVLLTLLTVMGATQAAFTGACNDSGFASSNYPCER